MPKLFNVGSEPVVISWSERAVMPGYSYEFTEEQIAAGLAGSWSEKNPRAGLQAEKEFKSRRDSKATAKAEPNPPAEPEKE